MTKILIILFCLMTGASLTQDPVEDLLDKGYDKYLDDKFSEAIVFFNQAQKIDTANAETYFLRGVCYTAMKMDVQAMADFDKALFLDPDYVEAYYEKSVIYLGNQNPRLAIKMLDTVILMDSTYAAAYVNRGTARCMMHDVTGAENDWKKAQELGVGYTEFMACE